MLNVSHLVHVKLWDKIFNNIDFLKIFISLRINFRIYIYLNIPFFRSVFTLNFLSANPDPGFYKIAVSAGSIQNAVTVKVLTEIVVDSFEIGAADADQIIQPKLTK